MAKVRGRKLCMVLSGICYLIGAGLTTGAVPRHSGLGMLILGRIMLGVGVGFANAVSQQLREPKYLQAEGCKAWNILACNHLGILSGWI